jgi:hypothetical protein
MAFEYANNASSLLNAQLNAGATELFVVTTGGSSFPTTFPFLVTLVEIDGNGNEIDWEIISVGTRFGDWFAGLTRGQQGTTDRTWIAGTKVEARLTAGQMDNFDQAYDWGDHASAGYLTDRGLVVDGTIQTANFNAAVGSIYRINQTGNISITMPGTPSLGDRVAFIDSQGKLPDDTITLLRNGSKFYELDDDLLIDTEQYGYFEFIFYGTNRGWIRS